MAISTRKHPIRMALDGLYDVAGYLAAVCLVAILGVIVIQMVARWSSVTFPGGAEYAGYLMAASSFLAFAHALNKGAHIRVSLLLTSLGERKFWAELWCLLVGVAASVYVVWYAMKMVFWSRKLHDVSQGQDATPLWLVQIPVAVGAILLAICFIDNLVSLLLYGHDNIVESEKASHGE